MLKKMVGEDKPLNHDSKVDLARLPPCKNSLLPHVQRVNHRLTCYKKANIPTFERPKPYETNQGWILGENNNIEPLWTRGSILPQSVVDLLETSKKEEDIDHDKEIELDESSDYEVDDDEIGD